MNRSSTALLVGAAIVLPVAAFAHISLSSGPGFASTTQELAFSVGHGCAGADTSAVRVEIPAGVTSVRPETSGFGRATVEKNGAGDVTAVTWQKADADLLPADEQFYKLQVRVKVPNQPFTTIAFPTHQTCKASDGGVTVVDWVGTSASAPAPDGGESEPAPTLQILPARRPGWNRVTVPHDLGDLALYFSDAQIVWKGSAAYSSNPDTASLISTTEGVTPLTSLQANDEIWVKY